MRLIARLGLVIIFCLYVTHVYAQALRVQPHAEVVAEIKQFIQDQLNTDELGVITLEIKALGNTTRLKPCHVPLSYSLPHHQIRSRTTVSIQCEDAAPWKLYVPVQVKIYHPVIMTSRPLSRNERLTDDNIILNEANIVSLHQGYFQNKKELFGMLMKQNTQAGTIITPGMIKPPTWIKRGQLVRIYLDADGLIVKMSGKSLEDGIRGQTIRVKNLSSKRIIEGTVVEPGTVQVHL